eukprot:TRINITY_DN6758_c0_g1_i8.p1 TRINITY_DN6758_c0_g1~~TRINITY_DN6758_c0_g1_i8.p1  ORF type:complete len:277 (+),score=57.14 TRINITY_DN6758_c0_g1_i8:131-961(+)
MCIDVVKTMYLRSWFERKSSFKKILHFVRLILAVQRSFAKTITVAISQVLLTISNTLPTDPEEARQAYQSLVQLLTQKQLELQHFILNCSRLTAEKSFVESKYTMLLEERDNLQREVERLEKVVSEAVERMSVLETESKQTKEELEQLNAVMLQTKAELHQMRVYSEVGVWIKEARYQIIDFLRGNSRDIPDTWGPLIRKKNVQPLIDHAVKSLFDLEPAQWMAISRDFYNDRQFHPSPSTKENVLQILENLPSKFAKDNLMFTKLIEAVSNRQAC